MGRSLREFWVLGLAFCFLVIASTADAVAQRLTADQEGRVEFAAPNFDTFGQFQKNAPTSSGKASVDIHFPSGEGPFPAVIVSHTVGGWSDAVEGEAVRRLLAAGYTTAGLDHFGPRGIRSAATGGFGTATAISDALIALKLLATHRKIDLQRIAIVGFSMGGMVAYLTAFEPLAVRFVGREGPRFAAHVIFYGPCTGVAFDGATAMTTAPVLLLYGTKDETTAPDKCDQMEHLVREVQPGVSIRTVRYEGAYHAWNQPQFQPPQFHSQARNTRACPLIDVGSTYNLIAADGSRGPITAEVFSECIRRSAGYTMGYDRATTDASWAEMVTFLDVALKR